MKECCRTLLPIFTRIINNYCIFAWSYAGVPEECYGVTFNIKENADHEIFSNFRPILNLKLIAKLIEKAVAQQVIDYLSFNSLYESFQTAYKRYHIGLRLLYFECIMTFIDLSTMGEVLY